MTFRELLKQYQAGALDPEQAREVEEAIDREDALLEYLSERDVLPELDAVSDPGTVPGEDETELKFRRELKRGIRRAFVKLGVTVGAVLLAILLLASYVLPQLVDRFYYDPAQIVAKVHEENEHGWLTDRQTNQMTLDMAVYSELFLPGVYRDNVKVVAHGYGEYDVLIAQNISYAGQAMTDVAGHISKNRLLLYDANLFKAPVGNAFEWGINAPDPARSLSSQIPPAAYDPETGGSILHAMGMAGYPEDARAQIEALPDGQLYQGFVSLDRVMDYNSFFALLEEYGNYHVWCAVQLTENPSYLVNWGFCPDFGGGANFLEWDRDKYPLLKRSGDDRMLITDAETAKAHMRDLLRYLSDHPAFAEMMSRGYAASGYSSVSELPQFGAGKSRDLSPLIEYLDEHDVQIYGFWIMADKETLLQLQDSAEVYSVAVRPLT